MKFIFISDTHLGAYPMGYQQQKGYPEYLPDLIGALDKWIMEQKDIDFVLHGGDMVDEVSIENIGRANQLFKLSVPLYLCLGNHDLNKTNAVELWLAHAPDFFPNGTPNYFIKNDQICIHVIPNQWDTTAYYWSDKQESHFLKEQLTELKKNSPGSLKEIHFLCTHSPVFGIPMDQTGYSHEYHEAGESFEKEVTEIINHNPSIGCVLSGHNHINSHVLKCNRHFITASSFSEIPFEVKLFNISGSTVQMETVSFLPRAGFKGEYDFNKTYVQGRSKDRFFIESF